MLGPEWLSVEEVLLAKGYEINGDVVTGNGKQPFSLQEFKDEIHEHAQKYQEETGELVIVESRTQ